MNDCFKLKGQFFKSGGTALLLAGTLILVVTGSAIAGDSGACGLAKDAVQNASIQFEKARTHRAKISKELDQNMDRSDQASDNAKGAPAEYEAVYARAGLRLNGPEDKGLSKSEEEKLERDIKMIDQKLDTAVQKKEKALNELEESHKRYMGAMGDFLSALKALKQARKEEQDACL